MDAVTLMMIGVLDYVREEIEHRYETLYNKYIYIYYFFGKQLCMIFDYLY